MDAASGQTDWTRNVVPQPASPIQIVNLDAEVNLELLTATALDLASAYSGVTGEFLWQSDDESQPMGIFPARSMAMIDGLLWVVFTTGDIKQLNPSTGQVVNSLENTDITRITISGKNVYAIAKNIGVGLLDTQSMALHNVLYPTSAYLTLLRVSPDEKRILVFEGTAPDYTSVLLLSVYDNVTAMSLGPLRIWDAEWAEGRSVYLSTQHGVMKLNASKLDAVLSAGFESNR